MKKRHVVLTVTLAIVVLAVVVGLIVVESGRLALERRVQYTLAHDPLWGPDGDLLVYALDTRTTIGRRHRPGNAVVTGELRVRNTSDGKERTLLSADKESFLPGCWSADGQTLYFRRFPRTDLVWTVPVRSETPQMSLLQAKGFEGYSSATDGRGFFVSRRSQTTDELWYTTLKDMTPQRLASFDLATEGAVLLDRCTVSTDGGLLLVVTGREVPETMPLPSLGPVPAQPEGAAQPLPSPLVPPAGSLPVTGEAAGSPAASPAGESPAPRSVQTAWIFDLQAGTREELGVWTEVQLSWDPQKRALGGAVGRSLAFFNWGRSGVEMKPAQEVPGGPGSWYGDGLSMAYVTYDETKGLEMLQSADPEGKVRQIYFSQGYAPDSGFYHCSWKPWSKIIAFEVVDSLSRTNIGLVNTDGTGFSLITQVDMVK